MLYCVEPLIDVLKEDAAVRQVSSSLDADSVVDGNITAEAF